ncbi:hypothetical protein J7E50_18230 [Pedobacter sp. ISL-68]|uniref:hypothetical protein n=1 Tax=unclassified Pedobacter TaxID=2628915 RepID=UPI001BE72270|nr:MULTISPECIES: hypothetical protein [unclassified Pedobacter]MBT2559861.1 hypothetical protein [Pedobacter sp. ISL-64]MBT2592166.1 hypothetical protein [Pedobacter sp. ISL-68]
MSNLTDKTEYRALSIIARIIKEFEKMHYLDMSKNDDWDTCSARNLLQGIVESNGYKINYDQNSKKPLLKNQDDGLRK